MDVGIGIDVGYRAIDGYTCNGSGCTGASCIHISEFAMDVAVLHNCRPFVCSKQTSQDACVLSYAAFDTCIVEAKVLDATDEGSEEARLEAVVLVSSDGQVLDDEFVTIQRNALSIAVFITVGIEGAVQGPPSFALHVDVGCELEEDCLAVDEPVANGHEVVLVGNLIGVGFAAITLRLEQGSLHAGLVHVELDEVLARRRDAPCAVQTTNEVGHFLTTADLEVLLFAAISGLCPTAATGLAEVHHLVCAATSHDAERAEGIGVVVNQVNDTDVLAAAHVLQGHLLVVLPTHEGTLTIVERTGHEDCVVPIVFVLQVEVDGHVLQVEHNVVGAIQSLEVAATLLHIEVLTAGSDEVASAIGTLVNGVDATEIEACALIATNATAAVLQGDRADELAVLVHLEGIERAHLAVVPFAILAVLVVEVALNIDNATNDGIRHQFRNLLLNLLVGQRTVNDNSLKLVIDLGHLVLEFAGLKSVCHIRGELCNLEQTLVGVCTGRNRSELGVHLLDESQLCLGVGTPCLLNLVANGIDVRLADVVFLVVALLVNELDAVAILVEDVVDGIAALTKERQAEVAPNGQVLVAPRLVDATDTYCELAILDNAVCCLLVAVAMECKAGGIDVIGDEALLRINVDATCLLAIVRSRLVLGCIVAAVDTILCVGIAYLVGINAHHGSCVFAKEELCRDDIRAVEETFATCTRTMESLCRERIDAVAQTGYLLADFKCQVVSSCDREDVGEATIVNQVITAFCATLGNGPAVPSLCIVELGIDDERGKVGAFGSAVQDGCLQQLLCKSNLSIELLCIELAVFHYV